jgi:hypothetical protein
MTLTGDPDISHYLSAVTSPKELLRTTVITKDNIPEMVGDAFKV